MATYKNLAPDEERHFWMYLNFYIEDELQDDGKATENALQDIDMDRMEARTHG